MDGNVEGNPEKYDARWDQVAGLMYARASLCDGVRGSIFNLLFQKPSILPLVVYAILSMDNVRSAARKATPESRARLITAWGEV